MLQMKRKSGQRVRSEGTAVTVKADSRCKILTIEVVFNYRGDNDGSSVPVSRTVEKRGRERERLIYNEEEDTGRPVTWDLVYGLMRCDVRLCPLKSYWCWEDP
ncbi:hypothetical protein N7445_010781 [Penicillium cf. griseofulvum]|nr:hypothetical protein N7445_010781 [Penicillium cf. griseofulvum]